MDFLVKYSANAWRCAYFELNELAPEIDLPYWPCILIDL